MRTFPLCAALAALGALAATATAGPDDDLRKEFEEFKRHAAEVEAEQQRRITELEKKLGEKPPGKPSDLQEQIDELVDKVDALDAKVGGARVQQAPTIKLLDISFNSLMTAGTSTAPEDVIRQLEGGHHDPHKRGFTIQNTEIGLSGAVDPYFKGFANLVQTIDENGDTVVELEEAYAQTTSLPYGLQAKAGQFFTAFGRLNPQHPHQWEFVDQPVVNTRMFGDDGMRGPGAQLSWLLPTGVPVEIVGALQNANGNTMSSFAGPTEKGPPAGQQVERSVRTFEDVVWSARADASFDLSDEIPLLVGVSDAYGPSGASSSGMTSVLGADVTLKWKPAANDHGFPFVAFQSEWMRRHFGYDSFVDSGHFFPGGELRDSGEYAQVVWGFARDWTVGVRYDKVHGSNDEVMGAEDRDRWSAAITWYTSEFAKLRLQVNVDNSAALASKQTSVWLQFEFNLGTHGAHKF
jgi:hypothetical protein